MAFVQRLTPGMAFSERIYIGIYIGVFLAALIAGLVLGYLQTQPYLHPLNSL
jgi:hypothetical protein